MANLFSFYGQFLLALQAHLNEQVPEIRYIDRDLGQLEVQDELGRPRVSLPCVLIDFPDTKYDQEFEGAQMGEPTLMVRLGFAPFSHTNSLAPTEVRMKGLQFWELENKLYVALQGFDAGGICQPLTRIREASEQREDWLAVRQGYYNTSFEDQSAMPANRKHRADLDLEQEVYK